MGHCRGCADFVWDYSKPMLWQSHSEKLLLALLDVLALKLIAQELMIPVTYYCLCKVMGIKIP